MTHSYISIRNINKFISWTKKCILEKHTYITYNGGEGGEGGQGSITLYVSIENLLKSMKLFTKFKIPLASSALDPDLLT